MIGSIGSNLAIGISLILRDQFTGPSRQAGQALTSLQARSKRAQQENARNTNLIGASTGIAALSGMREWVKVGAEFGKQMTYMYSIADKEGKAHLYNYQKMKDQAMNVGSDTMFSTTDVAKSMVTMAQAGQSVEQVYKNINSTAVLAAATLSDIHSSASVMNDIMIGFDIPASERNSMRVADIITKSINDSNIELSHFGESMKYIIPTAKTLGISLEEVSAIISAVGNAGIKGSMAGTNTENMFRYLSRAAGAEKGKQVEALAQMGLTPKDLQTAEGALKPFPELIGTIGSALKGMGSIQRVNVMEALFGVRGERPALLLAQNLADFDKFLAGVNNSQGAAQKTADDVMGSLWGTNEQLASTWENLKIVFTDAIEPVLVPLIKGLTWFINLVRQAVQTPIGKWMTAIGAGYVLVRTAIMGYRAIVISLTLAHNALGMGFTTTASRVSAGYNQMTSAAQRYATTAARAGIGGAANRLGYANSMGAGSMGRATWNAGTKQWTSNNWGISQNAALSQRWMQRYGAQAKMAQMSSRIGSAAPWAMIGGLGLQMGASAVGEDSNGGKAMNYMGGALGMAGTGAMLGSMAGPGVGTAVGAVIGASLGLLMTHMDYLKKEKDKIDQEKENLKSEQGGFDEAKWKMQAQRYIQSSPGEVFYRKGFAGGNMFDTDRRGASDHLGKGGIYGQGANKTTKVTINIDGKKAMDKSIEESNYEQFVNLGF